MITVKRIAYICDQKKDCARYDTCQKICFHTLNSLHAKHGILMTESSLETPRFKYLGSWDEAEYYMEVEENEEV